jgi:hypothetical protein
MDYIIRRLALDYQNVPRGPDSTAPRSSLHDFHGPVNQPVASAASVSERPVTNVSASILDDSIETTLKALLLAEDPCYWVWNYNHVDKTMSASIRFKNRQHVHAPAMLTPTQLGIIAEASDLYKQIRMDWQATLMNFDKIESEMQELIQSMNQQIISAPSTMLLVRTGAYHTWMAPLQTWTATSKDCKHQSQRSEIKFSASTSEESNGSLLSPEAYSTGNFKLQVLNSKLHDPSSKRQAPSASAKCQAPSSKLQAPSSELQASSSTLHFTL